MSSEKVSTRSPVGTEDGVLSSVSGSTFITMAAGLGIFTIVVCYGVSLYMGVVPVWLPMISDTFVHPPASYLSRIGMIVSGFSLFIGMWLFNSYLKTVRFNPDMVAATSDELRLRSRHSFRDGFTSVLGAIAAIVAIRDPILCVAGAFVMPLYLAWTSRQFGSASARDASDNLALNLASAACVGLATVGAVNEKQNTVVHSVSAVIFFFGFLACMAMMTIRLWKVRAQDETLVSGTSLFIKCVSTIIAMGALVVFLILSIKYVQPGVAVTEWLGTILILIWCLSLRFEFGTAFRLSAASTNVGPNHS